MKAIFLKINDYNERIKLLGILAENGYKVSVEDEVSLPSEYKSSPNKYIAIHDVEEREE